MGQETSKEEKYLSIIVTARNDNHGGNMLHRMQLFVNGIFAQSKKYSLDTELIIVEWNPPSDKPGLAEELSWPDEHDFCTVCIIEVPPEIHQRYQYADKLPLYQMIAKNVGITKRIEEKLGFSVKIPEEPQIIGALGAAIFAKEILCKGKPA